jgi:hypothetical protein
MLINCKLLIRQIPIITTPQSATINMNGFQPNNGIQYVNPNQYIQNQHNQIQQQNEKLIREAEQFEQFRQQQQNEIYNANKELNNSSISYNLPSFKGEKGTENFQNAFDQINDMLRGRQPLDLKKAVFLTENAFIDNQLDFKQFDSKIKQDIQMTKMLIKQKNYKNNENLSKNLALFQYMCDTTKFYKYSAEGTAIHLPYTYDFNDFCGREDWTKMFVAKLLVSKSGQCHSLPLLYLIYSQEIGTEAYLAYSPSHSYIKIKDADNVWYNLELTNGMFTSDAAIMSSGYIKTEAIKSQIYMDTISTKQAVSTCLLDLAKGYYHKFGYDDFMLQCADTVLKYCPNVIDAYQIKADYYTILFQYVGKQLPIHSIEELYKYPQAFEIYIKRNELYQTIDDLGYAEMPEKEYQKWLKSVGEQAKKQENQAKILYIQNQVK